MSKKKPPTSKALLEAFDILLKPSKRIKRKPKDPLAAVKRKHPTPWKAMIYRNHWKWPMVVDANGSEIGTIGGFNGKCSLEAKIELARAIAKLNGGK